MAGRSAPPAYAGSQRPASARASGKGKLAEAIRCALDRWDELCRFIKDARVETDSNIVERSIRPLALNRKNALFAGSDQGGDHGAVIAPLIETCKLNRLDPRAWLTATLTRLVSATTPKRSVTPCLGPARLPWREDIVYVSSTIRTFSTGV